MNSSHKKKQNPLYYKCDKCKKLAAATYDHYDNDGSVSAWCEDCFPFGSFETCKFCKIRYLVNSGGCRCTRFTARMFHPYNGRNGFDAATTDVQLTDTYLKWTPQLQLLYDERRKELLKSGILQEDVLTALTNDFGVH
jgi:hypothetical protein